MIDSHRQQATRFINENPEIYGLLKFFARQKIDRRQRFGMKLLVERVRWEHTVVSNEPDFKINNNHTAYIARQLVADIPEAADYLSMRIVRS